MVKSMTISYKGIMNSADLVSILIIAVFAFIGLKKGFVYSVYKVASYFVSIIVSIKFYPVLAKSLEKTVIFDRIKISIKNGLLTNQSLQTEKTKGNMVDQIIENLSIPDFLKGDLAEKIHGMPSLINIQSITDAISTELAKIAISIISVILLYIIIRVGLLFLRFILDSIAKLPLFKQINKLGGLTLGTVEGLLTLYIVCAFIMMFQTSESFNEIYKAIDTSTIAKYFYENNFIVDWIFKGNRLV